MAFTVNRTVHCEGNIAELIKTVTAFTVNHGLNTRNEGEGLGLLENWLGCTLPELQQQGGLSVGAVGPQGASQWRDYPRRRVRARSFAP